MGEKRLHVMTWWARRGTSEDNKIRVFSFNHALDKSSSVEIRTSLDLIRQHIQAWCDLSISIMHVCDLQNLKCPLFVKSQWCWKCTGWSSTDTKCNHHKQGLHTRKCTNMCSLIKQMSHHHCLLSLLLISSQLPKEARIFELQAN